MKWVRYLRKRRALGRQLGDCRKAWRGMTEDSRRALVDAQKVRQAQGITSAFDPHDGWVEELPYVTKPTLFPGMSAYGNHPTGHAIAYLRWVLYAYCGYNVRPAANWGPWSYSSAVMTGVYNTMAFFGATPSYTCSEGNGTWDVIDFIWAYNQ